MSTETAFIHDLLVGSNLTPDALSEEQVAEIRRVFMIFDQFAELVMPVRHLPTALRSLGQLLTEREMNEVLAPYEDAGQIDFVTFCSLVARRPWGTQGSRDELKKCIVNGFDQKETGLLDKKQLHHLLTNVGEKLTEQEVNQILMHCDANTDGEINYEAMIDELLE